MKKFCIVGEGRDVGQSNWKQQAEQIQSQLKVVEQGRESESLQEKESTLAADKRWDPIASAQTEGTPCRGVSGGSRARKNHMAPSEPRSTQRATSGDQN